MNKEQFIRIKKAGAPYPQITNNGYIYEIDHCDGPNVKTTGGISFYYEHVEVMNEAVTEQNYVDIQDLAKVSNMRIMLASIIPAISESISEEEYGKVGDILHDWQKRLQARINCK